MRYGAASALENTMGFTAAYGIALVLTVLVLMFGMRWFIFVKAGQKGWKALIPVYGDYIQYKIAWDGRIFTALLVAAVAASILGIILCLLLGTFGMVVTTILLTVVMGAGMLANMILQFKMAHAFGQSDYFAVGLFFVSPVFSAILAFGSPQYQGPQTNDGLGVPRMVENLGQRAANAAAHAATAAAQQWQTPPQQPQQPPMQQAPVQQPVPQGYAPQAPAQMQVPPAYPPVQTQGYQMQGYAQHPAQRSRRAARQPEE